MKLRYYLRGLGIGIFVTALIMGVTVKSHPQKMSESEIRAEAAKLGMVDGRNVLQETTEQSEQSDMEVAEESDEDDHIVSANDVENGDKPETGDVDSSELSEDTEAEKDEQSSDDTKADEAQATDKTSVEQQLNETDVNEAQDASETNTDEEQKDEEESQEQSDEEEQANDSVETAKKTVTIVIYPGEGSLTVAKRLESLGIVENAMMYDKFLCRNGYDRRIRVGNFSIPVDASNEEIAKIITSR